MSTKTKGTSKLNNKIKPNKGNVKVEKKDEQQNDVVVNKNSEKYSEKI